VSSALAVRGISKRYGDLDVLDDVSFAVQERDAVALLGPSGCGKTTLLRIVLGLEAADRGEALGSADRAGYLPQGGVLYPWKTVLENVELPLQIRGIPKATRRGALRRRLPDFGLAGFEASYPHELSGGMRQRAALLRAVMTESPLLVLDEPFGALDTLTRHQMQDWLSDLLARLDRTLLFVTHDLDEAVALSKRIVALTPRPASVLGEMEVGLAPDARVDRLGTRFIGARDRVLALIAGRSGGG
jgi:ABC-type nitrate/sulfonate/bicarbonate transport system ATPase subunit